MRKGLFLLLVTAVVTTIFLSSCGDLNVTTVEKVYGSGWVACIDAWNNDTTSDSVYIKNSTDEKITVKYFVQNTTSYDVTSVTEPNWETVSSANTFTIDSTDTKLTKIVEKFTFTERAAVVWVRVQDSDNEHYVAFSIMLADQDNMEWDIVIKPEIKN